jgi:hypothetical protein
MHAFNLKGQRACVQFQKAIARVAPPVLRQYVASFKVNELFMDVDAFREYSMDTYFRKK